MMMPHLTNCSHQGEGWCLACVRSEYDRAEEYRAECSRLRECVGELAAKGAGCVVMVKLGTTKEGADAFTLTVTAPTLDEKAVAADIGAAMCGILKSGGEPVFEVGDGPFELPTQRGAG